jgi:GTP-binding protein Era
MDTKSAFIAIVGRPNVGKSSLLNALVGEKVAIVSKKPQTTRNRITGIITRGDTQLVFIDTPGVHRPRTKLSEYMLREIGEGISDVDCAVLLTEPLGGITPAESELAARLANRGIPMILVVNKCDLLGDKALMLPKIEEFAKLFRFEHVYPISVLKNDGVAELSERLFSCAVPGPHFFDSDDYTDQPERVIVSEMIREKLLENLRDELPHGIAVGIERMRERDGRDEYDEVLIDIEAEIYCERESHKGMIIGKKGAMLKIIGTQARVDIERFLGAKINLQLHVKVREGWRNREGHMRKMGFK